MESPWKPYLRENILNPYPMYKALRENDPIHKARSGEWIITRYEDARTILKDEKFSVGNRVDWLTKASHQYLDKWESFSIIVNALQSFLVFRNPPDHSLLRRFIMQAWDSRDVNQIINENLDVLLANIDPQDFDLIPSIAAPLPAMTMTRILGLPLEDYPYLERLSHKMIQSLDLYLTFRQIKEMEEATLEFIDYFKKQAAAKIQNPDNSLLSKLIEQSKTSNDVSSSELIANCFFLFISSEETTASLIGLGLYHLIKNDALTSNLNDNSVRTAAIEELLRYDSPLQLIVRIAKEDVTIENTQINAGDPVTICLGAANRDPQKFEKANELTINRSPNHHIAFGSGIHRCLGDWLAKAEFDLLLQRIIKDYSKFNIIHEPIWKEKLSIRSLESLKLSFKGK